MNIKTEEIAVFTVSDFHASAQSFWLAPLENILQHYPFLENPHRQSFYTILYVMEASGTIRIDQRELRLEQGKVICIVPNSITSIDISRSARGWILFFTEDFFALRYNTNVLFQFSFLRENAASQVRLSEEEFSKWSFLMNLMSEEWNKNLKGAEGILRSSLNILLLHLDRSFLPITSKRQNKEKEHKVVLFEQMTEKNFQEHRLPSWYAHKLNISTNYLNRICREQRRLSSGDIIRKRIITEAQRQLHYTSMSVSEIAYQLGFESVSYFVTFFKKKTGMSPDAFRRTHP